MADYQNRPKKFENFNYKINFCRKSLFRRRKSTLFDRERDCYSKNLWRILFHQKISKNLIWSYPKSPKTRKSIKVDFSVENSTFSKIFFLFRFELLIQIYAP